MSTYGLDGKKILKLDKGVSSNVVTVIPDSVTTDRVAIGPALVTSTSSGVIPYREAGAGGQLKAVTVNPAGAWVNGPSLSLQLVPSRNYLRGGSTIAILGELRPLNSKILV